MQKVGEIWDIRPNPASHPVSILRRGSPGERAFPEPVNLLNYV